MKKNLKHIKDYVNANKHGEWLAEFHNGFKSIHKIHKSKKKYNRKNKHKNKNF